MFVSTAEATRRCGAELAELGAEAIGEGVAAVLEWLPEAGDVRQDGFAAWARRVARGADADAELGGDADVSVAYAHADALLLSDAFEALALETAVRRCVAAALLQVLREALRSRAAPPPATGAVVARAVLAHARRDPGARPSERAALWHASVPLLGLRQRCADDLAAALALCSAAPRAAGRMSAALQLAVRDEPDDARCAAMVHIARWIHWRVGGLPGDHVPMEGCAEPYAAAAAAHAPHEGNMGWGGDETESGTASAGDALESPDDRFAAMREHFHWLLSLADRLRAPETRVPLIEAFVGLLERVPGGARAEVGNTIYRFYQVEVAELYAISKRWHAVEGTKDATLALHATIFARRPAGLYRDRLRGFAERCILDKWGEGGGPRAPRALQLALTLLRGGAVVPTRSRGRPALLEMVGAGGGKDAAASRSGADRGAAAAVDAHWRPYRADGSWALALPPPELGTPEALHGFVRRLCRLVDQLDLVAMPGAFKPAEEALLQCAAISLPFVVNKVLAPALERAATGTGENADNAWHHACLATRVLRALLDPAGGFAEAARASYDAQRGEQSAATLRELPGALASLVRAAGAAAARQAWVGIDPLGRAGFRLPVKLGAGVGGVEMGTHDADIDPDDAGKSGIKANEEDLSLDADRPEDCCVRVILGSEVSEGAVKAALRRTADGWNDLGARQAAALARPGGAEGGVARTLNVWRLMAGAATATAVDAQSHEARGVVGAAAKVACAELLLAMPLVDACDSGAGKGASEFPWNLVAHPDTELATAAARAVCAAARERPAVRAPLIASLSANAAGLPPSDTCGAFSLLAAMADVCEGWVADLAPAAPELADSKALLRRSGVAPAECAALAALCHANAAVRVAGAAVLAAAGEVVSMQAERSGGDAVVPPMVTLLRGAYKDRALRGAEVRQAVEAGKGEQALATVGSGADEKWPEDALFAALAKPGWRVKLPELGRLLGESAALAPLASDARAVLGATLAHGGADGEAYAGVEGTWTNIAALLAGACVMAVPRPLDKHPDKGQAGERSPAPQLPPLLTARLRASRLECSAVDLAPAEAAAAASRWLAGLADMRRAASSAQALGALSDSAPVASTAAASSMEAMQTLAPALLASASLGGGALRTKEALAVLASSHWSSSLAAAQSADAWFNKLDGDGPEPINASHNDPSGSFPLRMLFLRRLCQEDRFDLAYSSDMAMRSFIAAQLERAAGALERWWAPAVREAMASGVTAASLLPPAFAPAARDFAVLVRRTAVAATNAAVVAAAARESSSSDAAPAAATDDAGALLAREALPPALRISLRRVLLAVADLAAGAGARERGMAVASHKSAAGAGAKGSATLRQAGRCANGALALLCSTPGDRVPLTRLEATLDALAAADAAGRARGALVELVAGDETGAALSMCSSKALQLWMASRGTAAEGGAQLTALRNAYLGAACAAVERAAVPRDVASGRVAAAAVSAAAPRLLLAAATGMCSPDDARARGVAYATARRMAEICTVVYSDFEAELAAGRLDAHEGTLTRAPHASPSDVHAAAAAAAAALAMASVELCGAVIAEALALASAVSRADGYASSAVGAAEMLAVAARAWLPHVALAALPAGEGETDAASVVAASEAVQQPALDRLAEATLLLASFDPNLSAAHGAGARVDAALEAAWGAARPPEAALVFTLSRAAGCARRSEHQHAAVLLACARAVCRAAPAPAAAVLLQRVAAPRCTGGGLSGGVSAVVAGGAWDAALLGVLRDLATSGAGLRTEVLPLALLVALLAADADGEAGAAARALLAALAASAAPLPGLDLRPREAARAALRGALDALCSDDVGTALEWTHSPLRRGVMLTLRGVSAPSLVASLAAFLSPCVAGGIGGLPALLARAALQWARVSSDGGDAARALEVLEAALQAGAVLDAAGVEVLLNALVDGMRGVAGAPPDEARLARAVVDAATHALAGAAAGAAFDSGAAAALEAAVAAAARGEGALGEASVAHLCATARAGTASARAAVCRAAEAVRRLRQRAALAEVQQQGGDVLARVREYLAADETAGSGSDEEGSNHKAGQDCLDPAAEAAPERWLELGASRRLSVEYGLDGVDGDSDWEGHPPAEAPGGESRFMAAQPPPWSWRDAGMDSFARSSSSSDSAPESLSATTSSSDDDTYTSSSSDACTVSTLGVSSSESEGSSDGESGDEGSNGSSYSSGGGSLSDWSD